MNLKSLEEFRKRRSQRGSELGLQIEEEVAHILDKAVEDGHLLSSVHHPNNTPYKDFTVECEVQGVRQRISFGITSSLRSWHGRHYNRVPQLCFPVGTKPETVVRRVLELFDGSSQGRPKP